MLFVVNTTLNSVWGISVAMPTGASNSNTCILSIYTVHQFTSIHKIQFVHRYSAIFIWSFSWNVNKELFMYIKMNSRRECCCTSCLNTDLTAVLQMHLRCCTFSSSLSSWHLCNCFHYIEGEENPFCAAVAMNQSHQATSQFTNLS